MTFKGLPSKEKLYIRPTGQASITDEFGFHGERAENRALRCQQRLRCVEFRDLFRMSTYKLPLTAN